jgi:hypothetical protein
MDLRGAGIRISSCHQELEPTLFLAARLASSGGVRRKLGAPECFVTKHRLDLGFLRGETEPKRLAGGWNLTE